LTDARARFLWTTQAVLFSCAHVNTFETNMDDSSPAPRVTGETLGNFVGKKVLVVGEVRPVDENTATVTMADSKVITVKLASGGTFNSKFVEFEATVDGPTEVTESNRVEFGDDFDQYSYGELCKLINGKAREMFF